MYSWEIQEFLKVRNYAVTPKECNTIIDVTSNPQISNIKYFCANNEYHVSTDDNYNFKFTVIEE